MRVLVTGINGFVGSYLVRALLARGDDVYGTFFDIDTSSVSDLIDLIHLKRLDVTDSGACKRVFEWSRPDVVFHLAAQASVSLSYKMPEMTHDVNVNGTKNMLDALKVICPDAVFLLPCSADSYGVAIDLPIKESHPLQPRNPYAESKVNAEKIALSYAKDHGVRVIVTRSFNHTGPGQSPLFVCSDWTKQAAEIKKGHKKPMIKVGNLAIERDFLDVRDVVDAYILLSEKAELGGVYNVSSGKGITLKSILDTIISFTEIDIDIAVDPEKMRPSDNPVYVGDNALLKGLGWSPKHDFRETLQAMYEFWMHNI